MYKVYLVRERERGTERQRERQEDKAREVGEVVRWIER